MKRGNGETASRRAGDRNHRHSGSPALRLSEQPKLWVRINWLAADRGTMVHDLLYIVKAIDHKVISGWNKTKGQWSAIMKFKTKRKPRQ
jgi:hypothetical protein